MKDFLSESELPPYLRAINEIEEEVCGRSADNATQGSSENGEADVAGGSVLQRVSSFNLCVRLSRLVPKSRRKREEAVSAAGSCQSRNNSDTAIEGSYENRRSWPGDGSECWYRAQISPNLILAPCFNVGWTLLVSVEQKRRKKLERDLRVSMPSGNSNAARGR
ncbi:hypothetical protein MHU86_1289 [Fragilaria crotonensis]|nr:hypothetical protein MHU86_1289 [Fragilaria crotonensis]